MSRASLVAVMVALCGCAQAATKAAPETVKAEAAPRGTPALADSERQAPVAVAGPAVEATFAGKLAAKPPLVNVLVDVTLRNAEKTPRWFVLPLRLPADEEAATGGVTGVEVFDASSGNGRAVLGKFLGTAGFQAVLVAAGGEVKLTKVAIPVWQAKGVKGPLAIDVAITSEITVGGTPAATWFGATNPASDASASGDVSKAKRAGSKMTYDRGEVPVVFADARHVTVDVVVP